MRSRYRVATAWASMHALVGAGLTWLSMALVGWFAAKATIPPFLERGASGAIPVVLLVPLLAAAAAGFCAHHEAPQLLHSASRSLVVPWLLWIGLPCLAPGAVLSAFAAVRGGQIDVAAVERNVLLLSAITLGAAKWLLPGLAVLPAFCYSVACYAFAGHWISRGQELPVWAALLHRQGTAGELTFALCLLVAVTCLVCWDRSRGDT